MRRRKNKIKANLLKLISLLCVLCMLVAVFASCGGGVTESETESKKETESNETESNETESNETESNETESNETESNETESNETESNETESNETESKQTESQTETETDPETPKETIALKTETVLAGFSEEAWNPEFKTSNVDAYGYDEGNPNPTIMEDGSIHAFGKSRFKVVSKDTYDFEYGFKLSYSTNFNDTPANMANYWGRPCITKIGDFSFVVVSPFHEYYNGAAPVILRLVQGGNVYDDPTNPNSIFLIDGEIIAEYYTDAWAHNNDRFADVDGYLNGSWVIDYKDGFVSVTNEYHGLITWELWDGSEATEVDFGYSGFTDAKIEFVKSWCGTDNMGEYTAYTDLVLEKYIPA